MNGVIYALLLFIISNSQYIFNDNIHYERIPSSSNVIGIMDVLDEIYIELYVIIHSRKSTASDDYTSILYIGNISNERVFGLWLHDDDYEFHFARSTVQNNDISTPSSLIQLETLYHLTAYIQQNHVKVTLNDAILIDSIANSHKISMNTAIYLGSPWDDPSDVTIYGLKITSSNSNEYNYICDYNNRFTETTYNDWYENINGNTCTVNADPGITGSNVWMGVKDSSSMLWSDYMIQSTIQYISGSQSISIIFRVQDTNNCYNFYLNQGDSTIKFARRDSGTMNVLQSKSYSFSNGITYTLKVEAIGNTFNCSVNNEWIYQIIDSTYTSGSIGFQAAPGTKATYSSLIIIFPTDNKLYTMTPTNVPSISPTNIPTNIPTNQPTNQPTNNPTLTPTNQPTNNPTLTPTNQPTKEPITNTPTSPPTTGEPTSIPTSHPINTLSVSPTSIPTHSERNVDESTTKNDVIDDGVKSNHSDHEKSIIEDWVLVIMICAVIWCCLLVFLLIRKYRKRNIDEHTLTKLQSISQNNIETNNIEKNELYDINMNNNDNTPNTMRSMDMLNAIKTTPMGNDNKDSIIKDVEMVISDNIEQNEGIVGNTFGQNDMEVINDEDQTNDGLNENEETCK